MFLVFFALMVVLIASSIAVASAVNMGGSVYLPFGSLNNIFLFPSIIEIPNSYRVLEASV